jgi:hypothetical protein
VAFCQNCLTALNKKVFVVIDSELFFFQTQPSTLAMSQISQKVIPLLELPSITDDGKNETA